MKTVLYKAPAATTVAASPAPAVATRGQGPYKLEPPSFSGMPRDFHAFCERFTNAIDIYKDTYSDGDLCNILVKAMEDREAKRLVERYSQAGYDEAMIQLKCRYGRPASVYPQLVEEFTARCRYDYSQEAMHQILERTELVLSSMKKVRGRSINKLAVLGYSAGQNLRCCACHNRSQENNKGGGLRRLWLRFMMCWVWFVHTQ